MAGSEIIVSSDIINTTSKLWVIKSLTWFRLFDVEGKGYFIREDADKLFEERVKKFLYTAEDQMALIVEIFTDMWDLAFSTIAVSHGGRTVVMWGDYIEFIYSKVRDQEFIERSRRSLGLIFDLGDKNHDGVINADEYMQLTGLFGFSERDSKIGMAVVDKECSGRFSKEVFVECWIEYYYTFDWNESTLSYGQLANVKIRENATSSIRWHVEVPKPILEDMGELWVRKHLTMFRHYDMEGSGVIDWAQAVKIVNKRTGNKVAPGQVEGVIAVAKIFWNMVWASIATLEEGKTTCKWSDFLQVRYEATTKNRDVDEKLLGEFHTKSFDVIDANHDSSIQLEEYLFLTAARGLSRHQAVVSFANIDINADGTISYAESLEAWRCFLYSKEWGSGTLLYGTLDNARIS